MMKSPFSVPLAPALKSSNATLENENVNEFNEDKKLDKKSKCDHSFEPPGDEHSNDHTYKAPLATPEKPDGVLENLLLITLLASQAT